MTCVFVKIWIWSDVLCLCRQMGGRRTFLLVNLVVVLLNAGLGILVNLTAFTTRTGVRHRYLTLPSDHANISLVSLSLLVAEELTDVVVHKRVCAVRSQQFRINYLLSLRHLCGFIGFSCRNFFALE